MNHYSNYLVRVFTLLFAILCVSLSHAESLDADKLWMQGVNIKEDAIRNQNLSQFLSGLKLMEKAFSHKKTRGEWCYEIGSCYYYRTPFGNNGNYIAIDEKTGMKWFQKGSKLGDVRCALFLYKKYRPKEEPYSILAPKKEWNEYFKARDKSWKYAGIALQANIPSDFSNYVTLGDAAWFTNNDDLAHRYFAKAADNGEYGSIDYVIRDERALNYLTSPKAMYEAGIHMWRRGKDNDIYGHHDRDNGLKMFEKSAKLNYPDAQKQMGFIYLTGQTIEPDTLKAISWYKQAAKHNLLDVKYLLGKLYFNGKGIDRDEDKAFEYFKESSDSGYIQSELALGYCYLYGIGTSQNTLQARILFQKYFESFNYAPDQRLIVADNKVVDLDYLLGITYYYENSAECIPLFEASLKNKDFVRLQRGDLLRKLANCYKYGLYGKQVNKLKADDLIRDAKGLGDVEINAETIKL